MRITELACLVVMVLCGCQASGGARVAHSPPERARRVSEPQVGVDSAFVETASATQLAEARADENSHALQVNEETPALSLGESIALSLAQNPDLIAARQAENVGSAALAVAQTYPFNPSIQVQATPYQDAKVDGPGTTYHYVLLMQTIQLAHQQQFREEGAASFLNSARWNIHQQELLNVAQTERLFFSVLYLRGILDLANASHQNNEQLLKILEKQLDAGQASAADVAIVRVDTQSTRQQVRLARANLETGLRDLKRQLGVPVDNPANITSTLQTIKWSLPALNATPAADAKLEQTVAEWTAARPDVLAARADVDTARAAMCLASASRTPDLQIGPYYQRTADGTTFLGFRTQMDIPVINNGRPLEQQRVAELHQRVAVWQQLERRAELEGKAALERYQLALDAVAEDQTDEAGALPSELESLERQFLDGQIDVTRVIQARTSMIQNQRVRLDLLNELSQSAANLTAATGISVEQIVTGIDLDLQD